MDHVTCNDESEARVVGVHYISSVGNDALIWEYLQSPGGARCHNLTMDVSIRGDTGLSAHNEDLSDISELNTLNILGCRQIFGPVCLYFISLEWLRMFIRV